METLLVTVSERRRSLVTERIGPRKEARPRDANLQREKPGKRDTKEKDTFKEGGTEGRKTDAEVRELEERDEGFPIEGSDVGRRICVMLVYHLRTLRDPARWKSTS